MSALLEIRDLSLRFGRRKSAALQNVNLALSAGERLGLIGESGSGKTVTALAVMGLLPSYAHLQGAIRFHGRELLELREPELARIRGNDIAMVFQEPMTALDPTMRVGRQIAEALRLHDREGNALEKVLAMLARVEFSDPTQIAQAYPYQLSGGQRQRICLAMALINSPRLIIFDEPTTALDVVVQQRILRLIDEVLTAENASALFISHDLAVISQICDHIAVILEGNIVEVGTIAQIFEAPKHPYTQGLVASARIDQIPVGERLPSVADFYDGTAS